MRAASELNIRRAKHPPAVRKFADQSDRADFCSVALLNLRNLLRRKSGFCSGANVIRYVFAGSGDQLQKTISIARCVRLVAFYTSLAWDGEKRCGAL
jgi:hypothetical protein